MIESFIVNNLLGDSVVFNDDIRPINNMAMEVDLRANDRVKAQQHGIWQGNTYLGKRIIHIEGDLTTPDSATYISERRRTMKVLLPHSRLSSKICGTAIMRFTGMIEDVQGDFTLDSYPEMPIEGLSPARTAYQINFKFFDPRLYGTTINIGTAFAPIGVVGRNYNKTFNKTYAPSTSSGDIFVTNSGDIETYPSVSFFGPCTGPRLSLIRPGYENIIISMDNLVLSTSSDFVTLDFANRVATLNSGGSAYSFVSGTWFALEPGNNTVRFSAFSSGVGSKAVVNWRNAYML